MPVILLIRHGENDFVGKRLAGGMTSVHLNALGLAHAVALVSHLSNAPIRAIYSSPLDRARETAAPLARALGLPIQDRPRLAEVDFGDLEGRTFKQLAHFKIWQRVYERASEVHFPGGESILQVQARAVAEIEAIIRLHPGDEMAACFGHADTFRLVIAHYLNMPVDAFHRLILDPVSVTELRIGAGIPRLGRINQPTPFPAAPPGAA